MVESAPKYDRKWFEAQYELRHGPGSCELIVKFHGVLSVTMLWPGDRETNRDRKWTLGSVNYRDVADSVHLASVVDTVLNGVSGALTTAHAAKIRQVTMAWHYSPLANGNRDVELHFNITLKANPASKSERDVMYHVYEDGKSGIVTFDNVKGKPTEVHTHRQNAKVNWHRKHPIAKEKVAPPT